VAHREHVFMNMHSPRSDVAGPPRRRGGHRSGLRAHRAQELRGRLLDAAETLLAERQAAAITARDIARRAAVSDGFLYNHFDDKHELVVAALVRRFERLVEAFQAEISTEAPSPAPPRLEVDLDRLVGASFRLHAAALPTLANVLSEPALFQRFMVAIHRPPLGPRVFIDPIEAHLRSERDAGRLGDVDPGAATGLLVGAILLLALQDLVAPRPAEVVEAHLHETVRALVIGLAPRTPAP
jgi:AcrR family transcriptional regulator